MPGAPLRTGLGKGERATRNAHLPPIAPPMGRQEAGMTGKTRRDGYADEWKIVCKALTISGERPGSSPVFGLRSKRGKLLEETSRRMRCPARKVLLVAQRSSS